MENVKLLNTIIRSRRSIYPKDYTLQDIDNKVVDEILVTAEFAPNHKKTKPWRLRVFRGADKDQLGLALSELYKSLTPPQLFLEKKYEDIKHKISQASCVVTVSVNFSGLVPEWEEVAATAMAVQNMYLMCTAHQVGCYWSTPKICEHLNGFLNLDENQRCLGLFYMGRVQ